MASQSKLDAVYLKMADSLSTLSKAERRKVGCLIVKGTQIISEGYNGTPKGFPNACEYCDDVGEWYTKREVLHAEANAITKLAKSTNSSEGATMYVTCSPCFDCAKLIVQAGISRLVYRDLYTKRECLDALAMLAEAGVVIVQNKNGGNSLDSTQGA